jgi:hypothetical protein
MANAAVNTVAESIWFRADGNGQITVEHDDTSNETSKVATGVTVIKAEVDVLARYRKVGIEPLETSFKNGPPLFRQLDRWRQAGITGDEAIGKLATFDR